MNMKRNRLLFVALVVLATLCTLCFGGTVSVFAAGSGYGVFVGGVEVTESNAADVLGDGTVSYDTATKTLTLHGATITDCHTENLFEENVCIGIYADTDLTVNCIGENVIDLYQHSIDHKGNLAAYGMFSQRSLTLKGTGSLSVHSDECGILTMYAVTVKDITLSVGANHAIMNNQGDITLSNVTVKTPQNYPAPDKLISVICSYTSDIYIENSTIEAIGYKRPIMNLQGSIYINESSLKLVASMDAVDENSEISAIGVGSYREQMGTPDQSLVIANSYLDITSDMLGVSSGCGKLRMENVTGQFHLTSDEVAYAVAAVGDLEVSGCDLDISAIANDNGGSMGLGGEKVTIEDSELDIEFVGSEACFAIASGKNMNIAESQVNINGNAKNLVGLYSMEGNISLTDCQVKMKVRGIGAGLTAGVFTEAGFLTANGGRLHIMATAQLSNPNVGCIYTASEVPFEIINADVLLQGNKVFLLAPDLTSYSSVYVTEASKNLDGSEAEEYQEENIAAYQYFHIHSFYNITFNANGGTGEMEGVHDHYGNYTLPAVGFTGPEGKQFKGWAYEKDGEVIETPEIDVFKNITLYAIWESSHEHDYGTEWKSDEKNHWKECECGAQQYVGEHNDANKNGFCDVCGVAIKGGLGAGAIVGIVLGSVAVAGLGGFSLFWFVIKKKKFADLIALFKKK